MCEDAIGTSLNTAVCGAFAAGESVSDAVTTVLTLLAVLGEEFCLLREHARWRAAGGGATGIGGGARIGSNHEVKI